MAGVEASRGVPASNADAVIGRKVSSARVRPAKKKSERSPSTDTVGDGESAHNAGTGSAETVAPEPSPATHLHQPAVFVEWTYTSGVRYAVYDCECGTRLPPRRG